MFQIDLLFARDKGDSDVGLSLEVKVPEGGGVFGVFVEFGTGERALAVDDAGDVRGELGGIGVGDHAANVVSDDVDRLFDAHMLRHQFEKILREDVFGVAVRRVGGVSGASVVGGDDSVAGLSEWDGDMAELVGCLWEAVDEEDGTLRLARGGKAFDVMDADLRIGLLKPDLAVAGNWGALGCHC